MSEAIERTDEEWKMLISQVRSHHKRLGDLEKYLDFPQDYSSTDHVVDHLEYRIRKRNTADLWMTFRKWVLILILAGAATIFTLGFQDWLITTMHKGGG